MYAVECEHNQVGEVGIGEVGLDIEVKESGTHLMGSDLAVVVEVGHVGMVLVVEVVEADLLMLEVHLNWPRRCQESLGHYEYVYIVRVL